MYNVFVSIYNIWFGYHDFVCQTLAPGANEIMATESNIINWNKHTVHHLFIFLQISNTSSS